MILLTPDKDYIIKKIRQICERLEKRDYDMSLTITVCNVCAQLEYYDRNSNTWVKDNIEVLGKNKDKCIFDKVILLEPKFNIGDVVRDKETGNVGCITNILQNQTDSIYSISNQKGYVEEKDLELYNVT